jgi:hypothetical protein
VLRPRPIESYHGSPPTQHSQNKCVILFLHDIESCTHLHISSIGGCTNNSAIRIPDQATSNPFSCRFRRCHGQRVCLFTQLSAFIPDDTINPCIDATTLQTVLLTKKFRLATIPSQHPLVIISLSYWMLTYYLFSLGGMWQGTQIVFEF